MSIFGKTSKEIREPTVFAVYYLIIFDSMARLMDSYHQNDSSDLYHHLSVPTVIPIFLAYCSFYYEVILWHLDVVKRH